MEWSWNMSKYEFILEDMIFSFSNLSMFEQCPYSWYLKYIEDRNRTSNRYADFGSYCHKILEMYANEEIQKSDLLEYYAEYFDENNELLIETSSYDKYYCDGATYFKNCNLDLTKYEVLGVEKKVEFEIDGHKFIGFIDLLLKDGKDIIVLDHKSSEYPYGKSGKIKKKSIDKVKSYKRQLYLYSKAVYEELGVYPKKIVWNYFRECKFDVQLFDTEEYNESLEWAKSVIERIYKADEFEMVDDYFFCNHLCDFRYGECEGK